MTSLPYGGALLPYEDVVGALFNEFFDGVLSGHVRSAVFLFREQWLEIYLEFRNTNWGTVYQGQTTYSRGTFSSTHCILFNTDAHFSAVVKEMLVLKFTHYRDLSAESMEPLIVNRLRILDIFKGLTTPHFNSEAFGNVHAAIMKAHRSYLLTVCRDEVVGPIAERIQFDPATEVLDTSNVTAAIQDWRVRGADCIRTELAQKEILKMRVDPRRPQKRPAYTDVVVPAHATVAQARRAAAAARDAASAHASAQASAQASPVAARRSASARARAAAAESPHASPAGAAEITPARGDTDLPSDAPTVPRQIGLFQPSMIQETVVTRHETILRKNGQSLISDFMTKNARRGKRVRADAEADAEAEAVAENVRVTDRALGLVD